MPIDRRDDEGGTRLTKHSEERGTESGITARRYEIARLGCRTSEDEAIVVAAKENERRVRGAEATNEILRPSAPRAHDQNPRRRHSDRNARSASTMPAPAPP